MLTALFSLALLLVFSEISSANLKRLAPVLEAWNQSRRGLPHENPEAPFTWLGGWEKLAALVWALGISIPLLAFALACHLFLDDDTKAANFILGSTVGTNIIGLSLAFALVLFSGPLTFFRVRTVTSPVFVLLATVVFTYTCLDQTVSPAEGMILLLLATAYGFYFRRFSSEWKHYERTFSGPSLLESAEGILPVIALICMGVGFFLLAVLVAFPLVRELGMVSEAPGTSPFRLGAHFVAFALSLPWLVRSLLHVREGTTSKALTITSISHACLLNVLLLPSLAAFMGARNLSTELISVHLPVLLVLTGIFVCALLIEKEKGGKLPWALTAAYVLYTILGMI
jgi:Ca2+/Na+ antiporter